MLNTEVHNIDSQKARHTIENINYDLIIISCNPYIHKNKVLLQNKSK